MRGAAVVVDNDRLRVVYRDRGRVVHEEVLCGPCYDALQRAGAFRKELNRRGKQTEVKPYYGDRQCDCEATS